MSLENVQLLFSSKKYYGHRLKNELSYENS